MGLGGTYSSALEDWLLTRHKPSASSVNNHFQLCDSVPDLSGFNENNCMSLSTNHSAPRKIPLNNNSRYSANANHKYPLMHNHSYTNVQSSYTSNGYGTPLRMQNVNCINGNDSNHKNGSADYDNDDNEVQLRRNIINRNMRCDNGNEREEWMYRRPTAPNDVRHSCK